MNVDGIVDHVTIQSPPVEAVRDAVNAKILDGLPLTNSFYDTPLGAIHDALLTAHEPVTP